LKTLHKWRLRYCTVMKRLGLGCMIAVGFILPGHLACAQTSLDVLEQDLNQAKQEHLTASSQNFKNLISQLSTASGSSDAALALYQQAGGLMPDPSSVTTTHDSETPSEKRTRLQQDQDNSSLVANLVQTHCGLMYFAVLFISDPNQAGLHDNWIAWLKTKAQLYPQLKGTGELKAIVEPSSGDSPPPKWEKKKNGESKHIGDWKTIPIGDSIISKYVGFRGQDDKEQSHWAVKDIPKFYRSDVLDPQRTTPTADTLAAWDAYIAMKNADQPDSDQWNQVEYPSLAFERASDDYKITPTMDKLEVLVKIVKSYPVHPQLDDMIARVHTMLHDYRAKKAGGWAPSTVPVSTVSAAPGGPAVTVTKTTLGDTTVITTTTNTPPATPSAPKN